VSPFLVAEPDTLAWVVIAVANNPALQAVDSKS
jgi:hypothetical protein